MMRELFSSGNSVSSKRVFGAFCILIYIGLLIGTFLGTELSENQVALMTNLLYVGSALIGLGVLDGKLKT